MDKSIVNWYRAFEGVPQKVRLVSNNISYGCAPKPIDEIEQRLTINSKGRVWFSA